MMAPSSRKEKVSDKGDIKKSSYYVWFLGAKESKGLRGEEFINPVVRHLVSKEKEQPPIKVTLQLSNKGLKIIQNVSGKRVQENYRFQENVKHFIPHHAITCAVRTEDVVSCILLIYNPATACPVHVHSYRCDSTETAEMLHTQLQVLNMRPENQKKFLEIESRLQEKGLLHRNASNAGSSKLGSDGRSLGRESDSGAGSDKGSQLAGAGQAGDKIASMYDNLAAELREKLGAKQPLLLPPRDYDTMQRSRGNVSGIENRKSLTPNVIGSIGAMEDRGRGQGGWDSSAKSSGIGSEEAPSPSPDHGAVPGYLVSRTLEEADSSDEEWAEAGHADVGRAGEEAIVLSWAHQGPDPGDRQQPLSSRFFQQRSRSGSSPPIKIEERRFGAKNERSMSPDNSAKDRFKGAKQLFMSLERKKDKERKASTSPMRQQKSSPARNAQKNIDEMLSKELSDQPEEEEGGRWSRYDQDKGGDMRWPKSDRDTGYVSRYSRDKSRSRDFDESPPSARPNMFVKSGKKSSPDSKLQSKRLSRFLSRETLESDGYDHIEEFDNETVDRQRTKVKRQPSRTSLKLDVRRSNSRDAGRDDLDMAGPRRGFMRREVTELDLKGYMQSKAGMMGAEQSAGFSKKYTSPLWGPVRDRALSPGRYRGRDQSEDARFPGPATKVLVPEFRGPGPRGAGPDNRYPSLDMRSDKRKSMYEGAGDVLSRRQQYPEPNTDYRRRSYHELGDIEKLDHAHGPGARNFQHSGRRMNPDPIGLPSRAPRGHPGPGYRLLPDGQRFPGLDRDNSRPVPGYPGHLPPFKNTVYHPGQGQGRGPRSFDHGGPLPGPGARPMFRHSYAEPSPLPPQHFSRVSPSPHALGRFGLSSLKPY